MTQKGTNVMTNQDIARAKEVLKELSDNCQKGIDGFGYEVSHNEMPQEEADAEIAIQQKYKDALTTALSIISAYEQEHAENETLHKDYDLIMKQVKKQEKQLALYKETLIETRKQLIGGTYNTSIGKALDIAQQALKNA